MNSDNFEHGKSVDKSLLSYNYHNVSTVPYARTNLFTFTYVEIVFFKMLILNNVRTSLDYKSPTYLPTYA